jgi:RNA polymerase sigma-70 factor (ECF subfamily)
MEVKEAIELAKAGSQKAFTKLYDTYYKSIHRTVYSIVRNTDVSDDITSEVFLRAFTNIEKFTKDISFEMWLKTIANNRSIDFIRSGTKSKNDVYIDDVQMSEFVYSDWSNPEKDCIRKEEEIQVSNAIAGLTGRSKQVLSLRYDGNLTYQEIADKLNINIGTVKHYIHKNKEKIKKSITNQQKTRTNEKKSILLENNQIIA